MHWQHCAILHQTQHRHRERERAMSVLYAGNEGAHAPHHANRPNEKKKQISSEKRNFWPKTISRPKAKSTRALHKHLVTEWPNKNVCCNRISPFSSMLAACVCVFVQCACQFINVQKTHRHTHTLKACQKRINCEEDTHPYIFRYHQSVTHSARPKSYIRVLLCTNV